jgi:uncharacterized RDD family membrane protein YckC
VTEGAYEIICQGCRAAVPSSASACPRCGYELSGGIRPPLGNEAAFFGPTTVPAQVVATPMPSFSPDTAYDRFSHVRSQRYGGFWIRFAAYLIDTVVLLIPSFALRTLGPQGSLVMVVVSWLYFATMESSGLQGTVGKAVLGLEVTDERGRQISFGRATGRYFAKILSALTLLIGFLMVGFTSRKRGLHDFVAGTLVLRQ